MILLKPKNSPIKPWYVVFLGIILVLCVVLRLWSLKETEATVSIGTKQFQVVVADTYGKLYKGLSDRDSLGEYDAMLFVFSDKGVHPMVMRDMRFSLDMIWVGDGKIVDFVEHVPLEPGKSEAELTPVASKILADQVLEFPAGSWEKYGFKLGDPVTIVSK
jgi:uncharacterized membrane protein (UPF0127 family)